MHYHDYILFELYTNVTFPSALLVLYTNVPLPYQTCAVITKDDVVSAQNVSISKKGGVHFDVSMFTQKTMPTDFHKEIKIYK